MITTDQGQQHHRVADFLMTYRGLLRGKLVLMFEMYIHISIHTSVSYDKQTNLNLKLTVLNEQYSTVSNKQAIFGVRKSS